ncbi:MAG: HAMP domain-containing protein, partial [candidate division Zixibacteria bacterium]|nr:HAMP domain-containing protein [candidate division Zixibacteria bacterium]
RILWLYALIAVGGILLAGVIGYFSSRHLTVPIGELVHAAEEISRGKFERRIIWFARDELGTLVDGFNTMFDRLKRSQEKLVQSEKIAAWDQMARKVAHEIKNPLTPIQVSIEDIKRSYDSNNPEFSQILNDAVETIGSEISRLKRLTDEFSQFARLPTPVMTKKDIRPVVADALRIYGEEIRAGRLTLRLPKSDVPVEIDADLFSQVLLNLVKNGFEASGADGKVVVTGELGKGIARVIVEDDGPGVSDDRVARLFTPYFTTKKGGTGLGLVIAYRIVFDHGGRIRYEKGDPKGARFVVVLPLAERIS